MLVNWFLPGLRLMLLLSFSCLVHSLYEDQIKKFDWRKLHVGALVDAHLELNAFQPKLLISTKENVIASLCPKTGELLWRQVLENEPRGILKLLQVTSTGDASNTAAVRHNQNHGFDMLTVQGHAPALIRGWNSYTGLIEFEWSLMPLQAEHAENAFWFYSESTLYHIVPVWDSHLEVTKYFATTGQANGLTKKITAPWIKKESCFLNDNFYTCVQETQLLILDLFDFQVQMKPLQNLPTNKIEPLPRVNGVFIINKGLISVKSDLKICDKLESESFAVGSYNQRRVIAKADVINNVLHISAYYFDTCEEISELEQKVAYPHHNGIPSLKTFDCKLKRNNEGRSCLFILATEDEAILAVQQNKFRWTREEALANIEAAEFIDLPLVDTEGTLEKELKGNEDDISNAFIRRITTQILQIKSIFLHVIGLGQPPSDTQKAGLERDSFGLHKMLVILTRSGKIFGIDNISGKHHWHLYLNDVENFANSEKMRLLVQRTSKHFPWESFCAIVAKDRVTGNGVLFRFNPITGKTSEGGLLKLDYKVKQLTLLAETTTDFVKGILLLDADNGIHVYPEETKEMADGLYLFTADKLNAELQGFYVKLTKEQQLKAVQIWNVRLGGLNNEHKIITVAIKNPLERVHSQGRVLGDRSVMYKYINPNLVAVATQANDSTHKYILNVHLVDVVSGSVVFSISHRKIRGPLRIVHSENWLAYAYYNDKVRRTEITTIELYEGKIQANSTVWSSLNAPPMPLVERQSYIIPIIVETLRETITERGITNKHVLIGTSSGAIIEMPWALLDPRRPIASTSNGREEGAIPYIPELPLHTESFINYNQTIARLKNIHTAPSGLESTCLVLATGLDMFVTRVAPSKTFDLLKEDFDYILISVVLVVLTTGSLIVKSLSSRKILKQAWK